MSGGSGTPTGCGALFPTGYSATVPDAICPAKLRIASQTRQARSQSDHEQQTAIAGRGPAKPVPASRRRLCGGGWIRRRAVRPGIGFARGRQLRPAVVTRDAPIGPPGCDARTGERSRCGTAATTTQPNWSSPDALDWSSPSSRTAALACHERLAWLFRAIRRRRHGGGSRQPGCRPAGRPGDQQPRRRGAGGMDRPAGRQRHPADPARPAPLRGAVDVAGRARAAAQPVRRDVRRGHPPARPRRRADQRPQPVHGPGRIPAEGNPARGNPAGTRGPAFHQGGDHAWKACWRWG